ncbi:MAG: hypothetical protein V1711_03100 [bacterium]
MDTIVTEKKFSKWRTFIIGGVSKEKILAQVKLTYGIGCKVDSTNWETEDIIKNSVPGQGFITQDKEEEIVTIVLTPRDFGYEREPTVTEFLDPMRLSEWSRQNAKHLDSFIVELLPAEAGPHIRCQYYDQPKDESLWIAMERMLDSGGHPNVFCIVRHEDGRRILLAARFYPEKRCHKSHQFVFRLRKAK